MWCKKCGSELPDNAKFCKVCGERCAEIEEKTTSTKENPFERLTKKNFDVKKFDGNTKKIMLIAIAIILVLVGFCIYNNSDYAKTRHYLKEGEKELAQENYEEAGDAFESALEIAQDSDNAIAGVLKAYNSHIEKKATGDDYSDEEYADILESYDVFFDWMNNDWEDDISDSLKSGDYYYLSNKEECQKQYLLSLGDMQMSKDKLPAARNYYDQVIEMDKKEVEAYIRKANTYLSSADALSALEVIEEGLKCCVGAENLTDLKAMKEYVLSNLESMLEKEYFSSNRMNYQSVTQIQKEYHNNEDNESYWINQGDDYPDKTVFEYYENGNLKSTIRRYGTKDYMTTITKLYNESGKPMSEENVNTSGSRFYKTWEYYENEQIKMYTSTDPTSTEKKYYDEEGRLLQKESYNNGSPENVYTENYNYEDGKLKSVTTSDGKGIYLNALGFPIGVDESVYGSNVAFGKADITGIDDDWRHFNNGNEWALGYGDNGELLQIANDSGRYVESFLYDENNRIISRTKTNGDFSSSEAIYNKVYTFENRDKPSGAIQNDDGTYKVYTGYNIYTYNFVYDEYGRMSEMKVNEQKRVITYTESDSNKVTYGNTNYYLGLREHWYLPEGSYETTETVYKFTYESCEENQAMTCAVDLKGVSVSGVNYTGNLRDEVCPWVYRSFGDFYKETPAGNILTTLGDAFANSGAYEIDGNFVQTGYYVNDEYFELNHAVITEEKEYAYEEYNSAGLLEYAIDDMNREYKYVYSYQYNGGIYQK